MILGDNIFYGNGLGAKLAAAMEAAENGLATVFGYYVEDPERFGVMEIKKMSDEDGDIRVLSIEEKPKNPKSNYAVVGLYFYPAGVSEKADLVRPSARGELEITSLNEIYLREGKLTAQLFGRGYTWMDAGMVESLRRATNFVSMIEQYQGMSISAPEEIAYLYGWIGKDQLAESVKKYGNSPYGKRLKAVLEDKVIF